MDVELRVLGLGIDYLSVCRPADIPPAPRPRAKLTDLEGWDYTQQDRMDWIFGPKAKRPDGGDGILNLLDPGPSFPTIHCFETDQQIRISVDFDIGIVVLYYREWI